MSEAVETQDGLVLVGYRGTGKSTVGRIVAERLGRSFVDADSALEALAGRPIRSIFQEQGEAAFRDYEERTLAELTSTPYRVIATGGGAVLRESNRKRLRGYGPVVWLSASVEELTRRLEADHSGRPALTSLGTLEEIARVLEVRLPLYKAIAHVEVSTEGRTPAEVAEDLIARLPSAISDFRGVSS